MQQTIFKALNVIIGVYTLGKLNKELLRTFFGSVSLPKTCKYDEELIKNTIPVRKTLKFLEIPKSTTELIQPLDTYGFHILKNFVRKLSDLTINLNLNINLHHRNNITKLQSLMRHQLSCLRYEQMFKYAWHRYGYIDNWSKKLENFVKFCFTNLR